MDMDDEKVTLSQRITVYLISALIVGLTAAFFLLPHRDFSDNENRRLASLPEFSFKTLQSGRLTGGLKDYASDHFPFRDEFLGMMSGALRSSGRKEIGGVYLAKDGALINAYAEPRYVEKDITQWTRLAQNVEHAKVYLMLVPTAVSVESEKLPDGAPDATAQALYEKDKTAVYPAAVQQRTIDEIYAAMPREVNCVDVASVLKADAAWTKEAGAEGAAARRIYYRTDHHWTTYGAYLGYRAFCESAGLSAEPLPGFQTETVTAEFRGTIWSKLCDPHFAGEEIVIRRSPGWKLTVRYEDTKTESDSPYNLEYADKKDKYSLFLDNQHTLITITNDAVEEGAIAVVKDSYANCFVPYLLDHYHTVYVFDTRYYRGGPSAFINEHPEITELLILYNMGTLDNDTGIGGIY